LTRGTCSTTASARSPISTASCRTCSTPTPTTDGRRARAMAAPHYVAGIDFNPAVRQDAFDVMARLIEHYRNKSTDRAPEQWDEPGQAYPGPELWGREVGAV